MSIFQALVLGFIQGLTEFLPISSSGHLVVLPDLFGWKTQPLVFDTTLHLGTASALVFYFFKDLTKIFSGFVKDFHVQKLKFSKYTKEGFLGLKILAGSVPAGLLGLLFEDFFESGFRKVMSVATFLVLGSVLMFFAEYKGKKNSMEINVVQSVLVGFFQALALFPGISRSGSTISGGMLFGLTRKDAAKFSFLLSIPIVLTAGVYKLVNLPNVFSEISVGAMAVGFGASFVTGVLAIKFLLSFLRKNKLSFFIIYRVVLAAVLVFLSI